MLRQKARNNESKGLLSKLSDDESEETELFIQRSPYKEIPTIEKYVEEGDTLQALSIRYQCPIAELKRLNNIHKENEIYAKRTIKVPARLFTMALVHTSGSSSPTLNNKGETENVDKELLEKKLKSTIVNSQIKEHNNDVNMLIFNSNIVSKACDTLEETIEDLSDEEVHLLPREIKTAEPVVSRITCSGADCDISWIALVVCIVVVIFAIPLIYVFYIAEHPDYYHHHKENNV